MRAIVAKSRALEASRMTEPPEIIQDWTPRTGEKGAPGNPTSRRIAHRQFATERLITAPLVLSASRLRAYRFCQQSLDAQRRLAEKLAHFGQIEVAVTFAIVVGRGCGFGDRDPGTAARARSFEDACDCNPISPPAR